MRHLPTMISLTCFEATARLLSVTLAAEELCLTQSAVSRQVKNLEEYVKCDLFLREKQRLKLSEKGHEYLTQIQPCLNLIEHQTQKISANQGKLLIGVEPSFASKWLLPKIQDIDACHPEIELEFINDLKRLYEPNADFDIGFLFGDGEWDTLESQPLLASDLYVVCRSDLLEKYGVMKQASDILKYPLLHHTTNASKQLSSTYLWLTHAGLSDEEIEALPGQHFPHFAFVLNAVMNGLGATVLPAYFVEDEIEKGLLVKAFDTPLACGNYYLTVNKKSQNKQSVRDFLSLLRKRI